VIERILVANRGEIARRIIRTARRMGIETVLAAHEVDVGSKAAEEADALVPLQADSAVAAYLDGAQMVRVALDRRCDAVHPGYGFLSENASFAQQVTRAGLTWIGPQAELIDLMGDKIRARAFASRCDVPLVPSASGENDAEIVRAAEDIGYPVLVKAAAGGGGKGMKIARGPGELLAVIAIARSEARRYFGDDRVYVEKLISQPRHIEVQVLGDSHGNVVHLGERECSIQRRFQKIIEEAPAPSFDDHLRARICEAAVAIARESGYVNAGTVEFVVGNDGGFHFLEMNTRLQVEHPVTELVTGLDLVEWQIRVARGERLAFTQQDIPARGHAIECRVYAEDAACGFVPSIGRIERYVEPSGEGIRVDAGVQEGDEVTSFFDPMLAKLVVWAGSRQGAIELAERALRDYCFIGPKTNIGFLRAILDHPVFARGEVDTGFIDLHGAALDAVVAEKTELDPQVAAVLAALSIPEARLPRNPLAHLGAWRN
jgi:propionyl-CoA carboxylase alpha chain/3-methylcrotonyl-CoA carboxylase alpha subunit/acetyl-CoA/propionyl-CoA carboxylase biotin carboxyl carrier protein